MTVIHSSAHNSLVPRSAPPAIELGRAIATLGCAVVGEHNMPKGQPVERRILNPGYAARLNELCDKNPHVPDLHHGRLVWIQKALKTRYGQSVAMESVRKWFAGESTPRSEKNAMLADLLNADEAWLLVGIDQGMAPKQKRRRALVSIGIVTVVAGFMELDGAHVSFPEEDDKFAQSQSIDLYAMIAGRNHFIHVSLGVRVDDKNFRFVVPNSYDQVVVLGVIQSGMGIDVVEIKNDVVESRGVQKRGALEVDLTVEEFEAALIDDFKRPI